MSGEKTTKRRRKGWVEVFPDGTLGSMCATRREAEKGTAGCFPVVERLRGDVLLSREDVARALRLLDETLDGDGDFGRAERDLRELLRGGR